jgi:hypothetical protein
LDARYKICQPELFEAELEHLFENNQVANAPIKWCGDPNLIEVLGQSRGLIKEQEDLIDEIKKELQEVKDLDR